MIEKIKFDHLKFDDDRFTLAPLLYKINEIIDKLNKID